MIIEMIMSLFKSVLSALLILDIPSLPAEAQEFISSLFTYIETGAGILANYTPLSYLLTLFFIILAVDAGLMIYHFVMWILKKIPMAGIS